MLKKLMYCVIYGLIMLVIYNSQLFKNPVRIQIIEQVGETRYRALDSPKFGNPKTYYINSNTHLEDWSFMTTYELSYLGNVLAFLMLIAIILTVLEETILEPTPFNPYEDENNN